MSLGSSDQRLSQPTHPRKLSFRVRPSALADGKCSPRWPRLGVVLVLCAENSAAQPPPPAKRTTSPGQSVRPRGWENGAAVTAKGGTAGATTMADSSGSYAFTGLANGDLRDYSQPHRLHVQSDQPSLQRSAAPTSPEIKFHGHSAKCHACHLRDDHSGRRRQWSHRDLERRPAGGGR